MAYKKPKLGQVVYIIYDDEIYEEKVEYIGEDTFLYSRYSNEYWYENYNMTWTINFEKAKSILRQNNKVKKLKLEEIENHYGKWWRIEWGDK